MSLDECKYLTEYKCIIHDISKYSKYISWELFQADYKQKRIYSVLGLCMLAGIFVHH